MSKLSVVLISCHEKRFEENKSKGCELKSESYTIIAITDSYKDLDM